MNKTILLIEDDDSLNKGISLKLAREGFLVHSASTLAEGEALFRAHAVGLIICDIGLPDGSGLDFCIRVRESSKVLFLFLTARDAELDIVNGYDAGADDYLTKPFSLMVLISKVHAMMKRVEADGSAPREQGVRSGDITVYPDRRSAEKNGQAMSLTANEYKLLALFLQNPRHILSKRQLLDAIWELDSEYADDNTVAVNIRRLREKIEADPSRPEYIKNVRGMGYLWDKECERL